jgi:uncharacterized protein (DUF885 family)
VEREGGIRQLADAYVERYCALDPIEATVLGVPGHEDVLPDFSPEGIAARAELDRDTLTALTEQSPGNDGERRGAAFMDERLRISLALVDAGEPWRNLNNIGSPVQALRQVFDLMPRATEDDWHHIARRMDALPGAVDRYRASLDAGIGRGLVAARRQALAAAEQCATWSGTGSADTASFFVTLADQCPHPALAGELSIAAERASATYAALGRYLHDTYAPAATTVDGVGPERYALAAHDALGTDVDLHETYAWAWEELARIEADMAATGALVRAGASIAEVIDHLETDSPLAIEGEDNLRAWIQDLMDRTIDELDGRHFDIPAPIRRVEAMIAPPGGAAAMYYTGPSEDFSRPGRTWYPTLGRTRFPLWGEVSIAYHEGVPGHHLQLGQARYRRDLLDRFQRSRFVSGNAEGWALYAERLMDELGYLDEPAYRLGMLRAQALRTVRVIIDIGMHLSLTIPTASDFDPGERWTPARGHAFLIARGRFPEAFLGSEIVRYLGWPGQAISYKVGERAWLAARDAARTRHGAAFDLRDFHRYALDIGPTGLGLLDTELAAF